MLLKLKTGVLNGLILEVPTLAQFQYHLMLVKSKSKLLLSLPSMLDGSSTIPRGCCFDYLLIFDFNQLYYKSRNLASIVS